MAVDLPTTPGTFYRWIIQPSLAVALPLLDIPPSRAAERVLLAIAGQESNWVHRHQVLSRGRKGPARGFWQCERIGVQGVLEHRRVRDRARRLVCGLGYPYASIAVWEAAETDDALAAGLARLLLWSDPSPLPVTEFSAWACYLRLWRPGKPHPERWGRCWRQACDAIADHGGGEYD